MHPSFLEQHDAAAWAATRDALLPACHEVDRGAVRIWYQFYPLPLADAVAAASDRDALIRKLRIKGHHDLVAQRDTSHWFLYGHRFWPDVKAAVIAWAASPVSPTTSLADVARQIAADTARTAKADVSLTLGISLVGLLTIRQIGLDAFRQDTGAAGAVVSSRSSPDDIVRRRNKDDSQGALGFLRGPNTRFTVTFDERRKDATFPLINRQHLTTAAATDTRDYKTTTGARSSHEGPIPSDCRSATCGTCWIGVLGGAGKLSEVEPLEARRLMEFGYLTARDERPIIRLACMARASGNVTLVIPTWHGRIGVAGLGGV